MTSLNRTITLLLSLISAEDIDNKTPLLRLLGRMWELRAQLEAANSGLIKGEVLRYSTDVYSLYTTKAC